jgi:hypothetical protein
VKNFTSIICRVHLITGQLIAGPMPVIDFEAGKSYTFCQLFREGGSADLKIFPRNINTTIELAKINK